MSRKLSDLRHHPGLSLAEFLTSIITPGSQELGGEGHFTEETSVVSSLGFISGREGRHSSDKFTRSPIKCQMMETSSPYLSIN